MSFESCLPINDAVIKYQTSTPDGAGGHVMVWTTRFTAYKCRIYSAMGMVQITQTGQNVLRSHKCIGEYKSTIVEGDALIDGNDTYRIMQVDKVYDRSSIHHLEMILKKENFEHA
jgi:hypothetical protein